MIRCPSCFIKFDPKDLDRIVFCPSCLTVFNRDRVKLKRAFQNLGNAFAKDIRLKELNDNLNKLGKILCKIQIMNKINLKLWSRKIKKSLIEKNNQERGLIVKLEEPLKQK